LHKMADKLKSDFSNLTHTKYVDQAKWYLNGFWDQAEKEAENIWKVTQKFIELDTDKKKEGTELDEFQAHKFLESLGETLTVVKLREKLRQIDLDCNGKMALLEYLCFKYSKSVKDIVDAPQGDADPNELREAQSRLEAVQNALADVQRQLEEQKKAEEAVKQSEADLRVAVEDLRAQETAYQNQVNTLETKSKDMTGSIISRNKSAAELAQLKQENPLPLRKAKITQEAALRRVEKQRKAAEEQTVRVQQAVMDSEARFQEAVDYLEQVKKKGGIARGQIWWMERELQEAKKYMPQRKQ